MFPKYMMATKAFHQLGEISSNEPDICVVRAEDADHYIGNWVYGLGFVGVKFPKSTTRELTESEINHYNGQQIVISGCFSGKPSYSGGTLDIQ